LQLLRNRARQHHVVRDGGRCGRRIKKSRTSGLFWTLPSHIIAHRFSAGRH
jgi:hypothetical protein